MANDVYGILTFTGTKEALEDLNNTLKNYEYDIEGIIEKYNGEDYSERFSIMEVIDTELENGVLQINTWNAWSPKVEFWNYLCDEVYDNDLRYDIYATDADNIYKMVATDLDGIRYAVIYDDGITLVSDCYDTIEEVKDNFAEGEYQVIIKMWDELDFWDDCPICVDLDGNEIDPPEEISEWF